MAGDHVHYAMVLKAVCQRCSFSKSIRGGGGAQRVKNAQGSIKILMGRISIQI